MNAQLYDMIFRRKSFHLFRFFGSEKLSQDELSAIEKAWESFEPLYPEIKTAIRIVPASKVNFKRDAEYCVLIYSEQKENSLLNAGYLGEQLDLWLVSKGIGTLWFGIGKADKPEFDGLGFVIMIAIRKVSDPAMFRKDMFKSKRKQVTEIWDGATLGPAGIARVSPSACNSQPWYVKNETGTLTVYRYHKPGRIGLLTKATAAYFNRIDIGIFLCFLELCMEKEGIERKRTLFVDSGDEDALYIKVAEYQLAK